MNPLKTLLIVDNEPGFHDLFRFNLESLGYTIVSAYDGEEGWQRYLEKAYDVVFSDVHMPKMRGPELLRKITQMNPDQPIVMMSSLSEPEVGFEQSTNTKREYICLYKPFDIDQLMKALEQALGSRP